MSDKIERYNEIAVDVAKLAPIFAKGDDSDAELEAAKTIRTLRQFIERLRRIADDGKPADDENRLVGEPRRTKTRTMPNNSQKLNRLTSKSE